MVNYPAWSELNVAFLVTRTDLVPADVSAHLGLQPTHVWAEGGSSRLRDRSVGGWELSGGQSPGDPVDRQIRTLVTMLEGRSDRLRDLTENGYALRIDISGQVETERNLGLSATVFTELAALGFPVTFTAYTPPMINEVEDLLTELLGPPTYSHRMPDA